MWTRNYKNLLTTLITCSNTGAPSTSSNAYGDAYSFNFKAPDGKVREICTKHDNMSYGTYTTRPFVNRNSNATNIFTCNPSLITDQTTTANTYFIGKLAVGFGSSATAESAEDYALGSFIGNLTMPSGNGTVKLNENGTLTIDFQIIVTPTTDVTIQEVGLYVGTHYYGAGSTTTAYYMLINRIVLAEPISIASGEVGNVTFSVTTPEINFS